MVMADEEKRLSPDDFRAVAEWIQAEAVTRKSDRSDLERQWKEIDRQLAMKPIPRKTVTGQPTDWYPALEEPLQCNAVEVILADTRAGLFPASRPAWYQVTGEFEDEKLERAERSGIVAKGVPVKLDQDGLDAIIKATMEYFHRLYDFRSRFTLFIAEAIKYGSGVGRVRDVRLEKFIHEYRGVSADETHGAAFLPMRIKNTYLDNSPALTMREGISVAPVVLYCDTRLYDDLKMAAKKGGKERGWRTAIVNRLEPSRGEERRGTIEVIEAEGDFIVPRNRDSIFLPNSRIVVAVGAGGPDVIRYETNPMPFHSTVVGHYMRQDVGSAYGISPLMKGWPVQEAASFALNDLLACGALNAKPPVAYDQSDLLFAAKGGPDIAPGAQWATYNVQGVVVQKIGDPTALLQAYIALIKKYEDLTQANDPRRGAGVKSHTTTGAVQSDIMRSLSRTEDFVQDLIEGPLTSVLHREYAIIRKVLTVPRMIPIDAEGMEGFIKVSKDLLPERVNFRVHGAAGVADEFQRKQAFFAAANFALQLYQVAIQTGKPADLDFMALITEAFEIAGFQDAARFVARSQAISPGTPDASGLLGAGEVDTARAMQALQTLQQSAA